MAITMCAKLDAAMDQEVSWHSRAKAKVVDEHFEKRRRLQGATNLS